MYVSCEAREQGSSNIVQIQFVVKIKYICYVVSIVSDLIQYCIKGNASI